MINALLEYQFLQNAFLSGILASIVAAITSKAMTKTSLPTHRLLNSTSELGKESIVLLEQIRTIDKRRLKDYVGFLDQSDMKKIDVALALSVGLV